MSLTLLDLDDRTYADLVAEARSLIPSLAAEWTDFNPADPGITLIELFAWLTEMLIYRVDRLPEQSTRTFLRLLNGSAWTPSGDLAADVRATVLDLRRRHRAVTGGDYEALALESSPWVRRARSVPRRDLTGLTEEARTTPRPGFVSVLIVPDPLAPQSGPPGPPQAVPLPPLASADLLHTVWSYLEARRLMTVRNVVVGPIYTPVQVRLVLARRAESDPEDLRRRAQAAVEAFLDPLTGGPLAAGETAGEGWPFGRDVYISELYQLLEALPGVDFVSDVALRSEWPETPALQTPPELHAVAATPLWHDSGDPIGLALEAHQLPWTRLDADTLSAQIAVGSDFVPVRVEVTVDLQTAMAPAVARRRVQAQVRSLLHPLEGGPAEGHDGATVTGAQVRAKILEITDILEIEALTFAVAAERAVAADVGGGVRLLAGELADLTVVVTLV